MGYTLENRAYLEKWATLGKIGQTKKNRSTYEKWSHFGKWVSLREIGSHLKTWATQKLVSSLYWFTVLSIVVLISWTYFISDNRDVFNFQNPLPLGFE